MLERVLLRLLYYYYYIKGKGNVRNCDSEKSNHIDDICKGNYEERDDYDIKDTTNGYFQDGDDDKEYYERDILDYEYNVPLKLCCVIPKPHHCFIHRYLNITSYFNTFNAYILKSKHKRQSL